MIAQSYGPLALVAIAFASQFACVKYQRAEEKMT
jgi:hypothetical protein